jgi:hypothetical protein
VGGTDRIKNVTRRVGGLSTNPAKFPEEVEKVVGWAPDVPAAMNTGLYQLRE